MKYAHLSIKLILMVCTCFVVGRSSVMQAQDASEDYRALIQQLVEEGYNTGNIAIIDDIFAPDYTRYPEATNREDFKRTLLGLRAAMPDLQATPVLLFAEGDRVALHLYIQGTLTNELIFPDSIPIPPNDEPIVIVANNVYRFDENGQVVEEWNGFDNLSYLAQIGALPMPATLWNASSEPLSVTTSVETEQTKTAGQDYFTALRDGDFASIEQILHRNLTAYNPFGSFDAAGFIQDWRSLRNALPDFDINLESLTAEGDRLAVVYMLHGTFNADFRLPDGSAIPPTGNVIDLLIVTFLQMDEAGRIIEVREIYDGFSFLTQLGLLADTSPIGD